MDSNEEIKRLLLENLQLSRENNKMLKKIRREAMLRSILGIVWVLIIIIGPAVLYYYFLAPYIDQISAVYQGASGADGQSLTERLGELLNSLGKKE